MSLDDLASSQGELALSLDYDSDSEFLSIEACAPLPQDTQRNDLAVAYISLCDLDFPPMHSILFSNSSTTNDTFPIEFRNAQTPLAIYTGKKYKLVALKVRPVETELLSRFQITRNIKGDPLKDIPTLSANPPPFVPTGRYTEERKDVIDRAHPGDFLLPEERVLMHHFMCLQEAGFTWTDQECGHFHEDFFPPIKIPTIPHKPWTQRNIPIPPGIYEEVCKLIKRKLEAGVYEPSNSSY